MKVSAVIARLKAKTTVIQTVSAASNLNAIPTQDSNALPVAFVYPLSQQAPRSSTLATVTQNLTNTVAVVLAVRHPDEHNDTLFEAEMDIKKALVGYEIDRHPIEFSSGEVVESTPDYLLWRDVFAYSQFFRNPLTP